MSVVGFFMNEDTDAGWGDGSSVEVEKSVELSPGRQFGVDTGGSKQVDCELSLFDKFIPEFHGEIGVSGTETGNEMVLECADSAFGGIAAMAAWGDQLIVNTLTFDVVLE